MRVVFVAFLPPNFGEHMTMLVKVGQTLAKIKQVVVLPNFQISANTTVVDDLVNLNTCCNINSIKYKCLLAKIVIQPKPGHILPEFEQRLSKCGNFCHIGAPGSSAETSSWERGWRDRGGVGGQ